MRRTKCDIGPNGVQVGAITTISGRCSLIYDRTFCWFIGLFKSQEQTRSKLSPATNPFRMAMTLVLAVPPQISTMSNEDSTSETLLRNMSKSERLTSLDIREYARCPVLCSTNSSGSMPNPLRSALQSSKWFSMILGFFLGLIPFSFRTFSLAFCKFRSSVG